MGQGKVLFVALLVVGILLFSGCTSQPPTGQASLGSAQSETTETISSTNNNKAEEDCPNLSSLPIDFEKGDSYSSYDYKLYVHQPVQLVFDGWTLEYEEYKSSAWDAIVIYCNKGSKKGENINYYYCHPSFNTLSKMLGINYNYLTKTITDKDGTILETKELSPILVYEIIDENFKYVKAICENSD